MRMVLGVSVFQIRWGYFSRHDKSQEIPHAVSVFPTVIEASMDKDIFSLSSQTQCIEQKFVSFLNDPSFGVLFIWEGIIRGNVLPLELGA